MGEAILYVDDFRFETSYDVSRCRICHEEEFESALQLEAPCACSGTIKVTPKFKNPFNLLLLLIVINILLFPPVQFAHRDCIQRWCTEKGSIVCEICLQVRFFLAFQLLGRFFSSKFQLGFR